MTPKSSVHSFLSAAQSATPSQSSSQAPATPPASRGLACSRCWDGLLELLGIGGIEAAGRRFLAAKATQEGVLRLRSGLLYRVLRPGDGRRHPARDSLCECHYRGLLINGREIDASPPGKPVPLAANKVIRGLSEALQLMVEGDRWELYVPPALAYGDQGAGGVIPGGATLVFQIELVRIKGK